MARASRGRRIVGAALVLFIFVCATIAAVVGYRRHYVPPDEKELASYLATTFPAMHRQTQSIQAGMARLFAPLSGTPAGEEGAPVAAEAVRILAENVLPTLDYVIANAQTVQPETVTVQVVHRGYLEALAEMKARAQAMQAIFADETRSEVARRNAARAEMKVILDRFEHFYARTRELAPRD